ncbi:MAG: Dabb family protein [gamma proteobacterium symbiont of Bathyaustriella thionipta]|nr:Dabb family protein [gamma proteobacterium symbiont of Bathyaustriella thionipta]MCU7950069.1 Dabb family protein [gamma proteobacterium symbiont of Bathyaustriella thionipta]MCU7953919.1 Dabb family protein [gamma proteobacterium symbiont of Bathyaustriella thionipta]MCU7956654.1 Dabb family protein [gamma proteobacterium symbiont of Bathyaustriella thionipta]MCU7967862.1 Dabb family protein [gamma proteobacterium symbiont of Bathyaustriella thionipta]
MSSFRGPLYISTLPVAKGLLNAAENSNAPIVLSMDMNRTDFDLLPSIERLARQCKSPVALLAQNIETTEQASLSIRLGCNAMILKHTLDNTIKNNINVISQACAIPIIESTEVLTDVSVELEKHTIQAIQSLSCWKEINACITQESSRFVLDWFASINASDHAQEALSNCNVCRPVEHLIIYNTTSDEQASDELAAKGRQVLNNIPGVRATWSGTAIKADAQYQWCWLIRFANTHVIESYRNHPEHVAYADNYFRPNASDRISIDYKLIGADEA